MADYKDKIGDAAAQILQDTIDAATKGAEFLKDQIPDLLKQLLMWNIASDCIFVLLVCALWIVVIKCFPRFSKWADDSEGDFFYCAAAGGVCVALSAFALPKIFDAAEILIAPKVWLLEYAAHLIKH